MRKLKVFQAQFGFYDSIVAAPSQAAALRAWGTHQNLFADGGAHVVTDEVATEAALAHREVPLRRAVGSNDAFRLEPTSLPKVPDRPKRASPKSAARAKPAPQPPPDRTALDAAEKALLDVDEGHRREEADFERRREALDAEVAEARRMHMERRKAAVRTVSEARAVYQSAQ